MEAAVKHHCYYREDSQGLWSIVRDWYLLPVHLLATLALCIGLTFGINGQIFSIDGQDTNPSRLSQSDVVTLVSFALVAVRLLAATWLSLAGWRMGFIVMEKGGATLTQLDRLISYRIPMFRRLPKRQGHPQNAQYSQPVLIVLWLIFLLATPSQFVAPIATGAITWSPYTSGNPAAAASNVKITTAGTTNTPGNQFNNFEMYPHNRNYVVQRANGLSSLATKPNFLEGDGTPVSFRRRVPSEIDRELGTQLKNVSIPSFVIHSLHWIQSENDLSQDELSTLFHIQVDPAFPGQNLSSDFNPPIGAGAAVGALSIVLPEEWQPENFNSGTDGKDWYFDWPKPQVISDSYLVMVLTHRNDSTYFTPWSYCAEVPSPLYGDTNATTPWLNYNPNTDIPQCYAIARVNFTAGGLQCHNCRMNAPGVVEWSGAQNELRPEADSLAKTAMAMMPEVLVGNSIANTSLAPTWHNLDGYTRGMLSVAYQASWNSLSDEFLAPEDQLQSTTAIPPLFALKASVIPWRVYVWAVFNALVAVSGCLLAYLQHGCQHKTIRHPAVSAMLLDAGPVFRTDANGLCNATSLQRADGRVGLRLHVRRPQPEHGHYGYYHPILVPDGVEDPSDDLPAKASPYTYGEGKLDRRPVPIPVPVRFGSVPFSPYSPPPMTPAKQNSFPHSPVVPSPARRYGSSGSAEVPLMHHRGSSADVAQGLNRGRRVRASEALVPSNMPRV